MDETISEAVAAILAAADADIAARRPVCRASGRCCHFEEWGHRLYVTGVEMVHFAERLSNSEPPRSTGVPPVFVSPRTTGVPPVSTSPNPDLLPTTQGFSNPPTDNQKSTVSLPQFFAQEKTAGCPYQLEGLCTAREARPLGCRIYFCDENAQSWQNEVYEKYHAQLQALHERFAMPYRYMEWREALRERMIPALAPRGNARADGLGTR